MLDAMALGSHLSAGRIGGDLRDRSPGWLNKNFGLVAAEPAFLMALSAAEVAELVESGGLEAKEEPVFDSTTRAWWQSKLAEGKLGGSRRACMDKHTAEEFHHATVAYGVYLRLPQTRFDLGASPRNVYQLSAPVLVRVASLMAKSILW